MIPAALQNKIDSWFMSMRMVPVGGQQEPLGIVIQEVNAFIAHLADRLYAEYEPTRGPYPDFWQRLDGWLRNADDEEAQITLFRFLPHIFFVGPREFESLYRVAFNNQIATWLIDQIGLHFDVQNPEGRLQEAVAETWFCPITDSMRINAFYHINHIVGRDYRPDWKSLYRLGSVEKIVKFIEYWGIKRIVLLEDFVGNGGQAKKAIHFAAEHFGNIPVLVVPLLMCSCGLRFTDELQHKYPHVRVSPCITLPETQFINDVKHAGEDALFANIRDLCSELTAQMKAGLAGEELERADSYLPFGWHKTGAMVVLYTNCPNNSLPIIFHRSPHWHPLFPRSARV